MKHANTLLQRAADLLQEIDEMKAAEPRHRQVDRAKALRILHQFQRYRRGSIDFDQMGFDPKQIGWAIDFAIRELRKNFRPIEVPAVTVGRF